MSSRIDIAFAQITHRGLIDQQDVAAEGVVNKNGVTGIDEVGLKVRSRQVRRHEAFDVGRGHAWRTGQRKSAGCKRSQFVEVVDGGGANHESIVRDNGRVRATATGSLPGQDYLEASRMVWGLFDGELPFVPELPERGAIAGMLGRTVALLPLPIDLQPAGWRLAGGEGRDQRRARSLLAQDLDVCEELSADRKGPLKQQITGPLTLAATLERLRGDKVLSDHGARRELAEALAEGVRDHVADLRRRCGDDLIIQIDEPAVTAVLAGQIPTMSGFGRHRGIAPPEADELWRMVTSAVVSAGAVPVVHSCAEDVPVGLLAGAGFVGVAVDLALTAATDAWAEAIDAGLEPWLGTDSPRAVEAFCSRLGFTTESLAERLVVTTPCGLAGRTPLDARAVLESTLTAKQSLLG